MTREQLRDLVVKELSRLAPELDRAALPDTLRIRDDLDLDSFDFVRLVASLSEQLALPIPELDYGKLETLGSCVAYLGQKLSGSQPQPA